MPPAARSAPAPAATRSIRLASSQSDIESVRGLFREYRGWLEEHREVTAFDDSILKVGLAYFDQEIEDLPGPYGPPHGALLIAFDGNAAVGCGAVKRFRRGVGEIKRVYVRPASQGAGHGRAVAMAVIDHARDLGYERVVLDTLPGMTAAVALYRSLGFVPIESYWANPVEGALYFELRLRRRNTRAPTRRG
jgi:ribosomal protein S18 acetylase RimI-like enzyme